MNSFRIFSVLLLLGLNAHLCPMDYYRLSRMTLVTMCRAQQTRLFSQRSNNGVRMSLQYEQEQERLRKQKEKQEAIQREERRIYREKKEREKENERLGRTEEEIIGLSIG